MDSIRNMSVVRKLFTPPHTLMSQSPVIGEEDTVRTTPPFSLGGGEGERRRGGGRGTVRGGEGEEERGERGRERRGRERKGEEGRERGEREREGERERDR